MKRQDLLLAYMKAYAADQETDALLLKSIGISSNAKIVKSKLLTIDPVTKALLVKWVGSVPVPTGAQIVSVLEALTGKNKLKAEAIRILDEAEYFTGKDVEIALIELATAIAIQNDAIKDFHIDWGIEANQVGAVDLPIEDAGGYWDVENVEDIISQIGDYAVNRVSKGWYTGGVVTCNIGALTVDVTSGTGNWGGTRNISWDATADIAITADVLNYIYVDTADSIVKNTTTKATADAQIPLAIVLANATEGIKISPYRTEISDFHFQLHHYLQSVIGPICETGMGVSINTPAVLNIVIDTGAFHWGLFHYVYTTESPCSFSYWHKITTLGITRWVKTITQTDINNAQYNLDTAGVWSYANLGANKYRKDLVCTVPKTDETMNIGVVLGQEQFNSVSAAREGAIPTLGDLETMGFATLAYVIIKSGDATIAEVGDMRPLLGQYGAMTDHGSLTGLGDFDHPQYMKQTNKTLIYLGL